MFADRSPGATPFANRVVHRDIVSPFCLPTCDDLEFVVENNRIVAVEGGCDFCRERFLAANDDERAIATLEGKPAALEKALDVAASVLADAHALLIVGLERLTCEAQSLAISLGDRLGATIDTWASLAATCRGLPLQRYGETSCTLGDLRDRADLVLFWGRRDYAVPANFFKRFLQSNRDARAGLRSANRPYVVLVEEQTADPTANCFTGHVPVSTFADEVLRPAAGSAGDSICVVRALLHGVDFNGGAVEQATGVSLSRWQKLVERLKQSRYGVLCTAYDDFLMHDDRDAIAAMHQLAVELNACARFASLNLSQSGNSVGAEQVLAWRTGFSSSVNLAAEYPRFGPREFTMDKLLARGEADAILTFDTMLWTALSDEEFRAVTGIPVVVVNSLVDGGVSDSVREHSSQLIELNVAAPGVQTAGTWFRCDGVPLPLRAIIQSTLPSAEQILRDLTGRLCNRND
ncbi:MAG: hypothetical protein WD894_11250 [Pirellulales bacterium]